MNRTHRHYERDIVDLDGTIHVDDEAPTNPSVEDLWLDTSSGLNISVGNSTPSNPNVNDLWIDTN